MAIDIEFTPSEIQRYLTERGLKLRVNGKELRGPCPIHHGKRPNFSINPVIGLWQCFSECGRGGSLIGLEMELGGKPFDRALEEVFRIVGRAKPNGRTAQQERFLTTYDYVDEDGKLLFQCVRFLPKNFRQRRPDGKGGWIWDLEGVRRVLYRLSRLKDAELILIAEGEKDVHQLERLGYVATCNPMGAGKWLDSYSDMLAGKHVVVFGDQDEPGRRHVEQVARSLAGKARSVKIIRPVWEGKDVSDWVRNGATREIIEEAIRSAESPTLPAGTGPKREHHEPTAEPEADKAESTGRIAPEPRYDSKTGKLIGPIPTVGDTLLADHFFAHNEGEKLHLYEKGVYRDKGSLLVRVRSKQLMQRFTGGKQWTKAFAGNVEEWVFLESSELWGSPPLDRINLLNGIYNLKTGKLEPHSHKWLSPVQLPITYDPKARCPAWNKFLEEAAPADVYEQEVIFQLAGLLIVPYMGAQRSVLLQGDRGTGKSRLLAGLRALLGVRNVSTKSLHQLEENRFASAYLYGKLANIFADLPARHLETTSTFKQITGEDYIDGEYKHGAQFHFKPFCRLLFSANLPPQSKDTSGAFLDRWWVFPFMHRFEGSTEQIAAEVLDQRLAKPSELSGVLNRALEYVPLVLKQHGITVTNSMREAHDEFCAVTDPFRVWLRQFVIADVEAICPCDDAYRSYQEFRKHRREPLITISAFGGEFKRHNPRIDRKQRTVSRRLQWCYIGVRLKENLTTAEKTA